MIQCIVDNLHSVNTVLSVTFTMRLLQLAKQWNHLKTTELPANGYAITWAIYMICHIAICHLI